MSDLIRGEIETIKHCIKDGDIVFDVGAHHGEWTNEVRKVYRRCVVHAFEPSLKSFEALCVNQPEYFTVPIPYAVSCDNGTVDFWEYADVPTLSTIYKRNEHNMKRFGVLDPIVVKVKKISLDSYCSACEISRLLQIDFLKIDVEGSELDVLKGAEKLLATNNIKYIQFEYGGCFPDAGITLKEVYLYLKSFGYKTGLITAQGVEFIQEWDERMENYLYNNYLSVCGCGDENILY